MAEHLVLSMLDKDPDLPVLERMLSEFDAFSFLGVSRSEVFHSKILAWLLDPLGSHSLGDFFLTNFLVETEALTKEQVRAADWLQTSVRREWHNVVDGRNGYLDILILNADSSFACGIENKIFSSEHSSQLTRYRRALKERYENYSRSHLFMSPEGTSPSDSEERSSWTPVDYGKILSLVEMTIKEGVDPENESVASFLRQYTTTLRRIIVPDSNMRQLATKIYLRHKKTLDFIFDNKDGYIKDVINICEEAIRLQCSWRLLGEREGKLVGFQDKSWEYFDIFRTGTVSWYDSSPLLLLDFDLRQTGKVLLNLTLCPGSNDVVRQRLFEETQRYPEIFNHRTSERGGQLRNSYTRLYESEPILSEFNFHNWDRAEARKRILEWVSDFAKDEFPRMNRIIVNSFREIEEELSQEQDAEIVEST